MHLFGGIADTHILGHPLSHPHPMASTERRGKKWPV